MKNLQCGMRSRSYWCSLSHVLFFLHTLRIQNVLQRVKKPKNNGECMASHHTSRLKWLLLLWRSFATAN
jgi:hypothetical protein